MTSKRRTWGGGCGACTQRRPDGDLSSPRSFAHFSHCCIFWCVYIFIVSWLMTYSRRLTHATAEQTWTDSVSSILPPLLTPHDDDLQMQMAQSSRRLASRACHLADPLSQLCAAFREPSQQFCRRGQRASAVQRLHATRARGVLISILIGAGAAPCGIFNLDEI